MDRFYMMVSIADREELNGILSVFRKHGADVNFISLGHGTAFIDSTPKAVTHTLVTKDAWVKIKASLEWEMDIDLPNRGIVFTVPLSSIGRVKQLKLLAGSQEINIGEESTLKDTIYELIVIIAYAGYSDSIMTAARKGGANGGTIVHAKGSGVKGSEDFFGVTLAAEKEMVYIVTKKEKKNSIMSAVLSECGEGTRPNAVIMSLPVTSTAGMRFYEIKEAEPLTEAQ